MRAIRSFLSLTTFRRMGRLRPGERQGRNHVCLHASLEPRAQTLTDPCSESCTRGWRDRDGGMKVLWPRRRGAQSSRARQAALNQRAALNKSMNWCRWSRNWCGPRARSPRFSDLNRVRASESSRGRTAPRRRQARLMRRGGWWFPDQGRGILFQAIQPFSESRLTTGALVGDGEHGSVRSRNDMAAR
jgi:hypothetical protein